MPLPATAQTEGDLIGAWRYTCKDGPCRVYIGISQGNETLLTWSIQKDSKTGIPTNFIRVAIGVALPPGLRVYTSENEFLHLPFQVCEINGCTAAAPLDEKSMAQLGSHTSVRVATIQFNQAKGETQAISYEVPIHGIEEAVQAIDK